MGLFRLTRSNSMKPYRVLLTVACITFALSSAASTTRGIIKARVDAGQVSAFAMPSNTSPHRIRAMQLVEHYNGWILTDSGLLWTSSDGDRWNDITPLGLDATAILAVHFADVSHGWVVASTPSFPGPPQFLVAATRVSVLSCPTSNLTFAEDIQMADGSL